MEEKGKIYAAGFTFLLFFIVFLIAALTTGWNETGQISGGLAAFFGCLGLGSILKPDSIGIGTLHFLENISKNDGNSKSNNTQTQTKSSGTQVMANGSTVNIKNIHVNSRKTKHEESSSDKEQSDEIEKEQSEKELLRDETIVVNDGDEYSYDFVNLKKGDHLRGRLSSTQKISVYFVDTANFKYWNEGEEFESDDCNENILKTSIDYEVPRRGTWHIIIINENPRSAKVEIKFFITKD